MKKIKIVSLLSIITLISCSKQESLTFQVKEVKPVEHVMALSDKSTTFIHKASIAPSIVDGKALQATAMTKDASHVYVAYNTQGEAVRGGLDIYGIQNFKAPVLISSVVSNQSEFADIKQKGNYLYLSGQKKGVEKNPAVLTVINIQDKANPQIVKELTFDDGRYGTSLDIEGNFVYVTVPNIGLKIVDISDPLNPVLHSTEYIALTESVTSGTYVGSQPSLPPRFVLEEKVTEWHPDTYNSRYGHEYQLRFKHDVNNYIDGRPAYKGWEICFNSDLPIGNTQMPWNSNITSLGNNLFKITPKYAHVADMWHNSFVDIGWHTMLSSPLNRRRISNIKLAIEGADCAEVKQVVSPEFTKSLFVKRFNSKSLILGGKNSTKIIGYDSQRKASLVSEIDSISSEAPSRFLISGQKLYSNAAFSGLTIVKNLSQEPTLVSKTSLAGTGNGLDFDATCNKMYLAQGEAGLQVFDLTREASPEELGTFDFADDAGSANNVLLYKGTGSKDFIFISDGLGGLKIIEVRNN